MLTFRFLGPNNRERASIFCKNAVGHALTPNPGGKLCNDQPRRTSGKHYERCREVRVLFPALTLINIRRTVLMETHRFVISASELFVYAPRIIMDAEAVHETDNIYIYIYIALQYYYENKISPPAGRYMRYIAFSCR